MNLYQSFYEFNVLANQYKSNDLETFKSKFDTIFSSTYQMATEQLEIIQELINESTNTYEYVTQILLENVAQIKNSPEKSKIKNLIDELEFAKLAYKESFEKDASEIDDVENLLLEWTRLLNLNKKLCVFMFSQASFPQVQPIIEMLISARDVLAENIDVLSKPLKSLYIKQSENLALYNTICQMNRNASNIHKNY